jgi:hypothetical protein
MQGSWCSRFASHTIEPLAFSMWDWSRSRPLGVVIQYLNERTGDGRSFTITAAVDACLRAVATETAF